MAIRANRVCGAGAALTVTLMLVGWGATEREKVEHVAKERWKAHSALCKHRGGNLYGCVLVGARIPLRLQFTNDFLSSKQHRCFRATRKIVDVSTTTAGYACAFGRST